MNTIKKLIIICLLAVVGLFSIMPSTFSWYNHSDTRTGEKMYYQRDDLPVSSGTVTMSTEKLKMVDKDSEGNNLAHKIDVEFDDKGDLISDGAIGNSNTIGAGNNQYYRTILQNATDKDAMVSLYLANITNNEEVKVGCVAPTVTERGYSSYGSAIRAIEGKTRVYFQPRNAKSWSSAESLYLRSDAASGNTTMYRTGSDNDSNVTWYGDLPAGTTQFYFTTGSSGNWYRTATITDYRPGTVYYLSGYTDDDGSGHAQMKKKTISKLISVSQYYDKITIKNGQNANIALRAGDYTGESVTYTIPNDNFSRNYLSVNANTGIVSCSADIPTNSNGANVNVKLKSSLGDELLLTIKATTPDTLSYVPISQNILVPARELKDGEYENGKVAVEWYVKNEEGSGSAGFTGLFFTQ